MPTNKVIFTVTPITNGYLLRMDSVFVGSAETFYASVNDIAAGIETMLHTEFAAHPEQHS